MDRLDTLGAAAAAVVVVEFEAWPEPKALGPDELAGLVKRSGVHKAAEAIGASEAFVRQNAAK